jgi:hypothetical protein
MSLAPHPTLPPKQRSDYQVEVGGEIRLAGRGRARCSAHYQQATPRQRTQVPTGKMTQPPLHGIAHHRRSHCPADDETHVSGILAVLPHQQVTGD